MFLSKEKNVDGGAMGNKKSFGGDEYFYYLDYDDSIYPYAPNHQNVYLESVQFAIHLNTAEK